MLTPDRFEQIKASTKNYEASHITDLDLAGLGDIFQMLLECVTEIERRNILDRALANATRAKPTILDARGQTIMPAPVSAQLAAERREQYDKDRLDAIMSLEPDQWRVFALRWGVSTPPPGGWSNHEAILNVMHAVRLGVDGVPHLAKHISAMYLQARGIPLPKGIMLIDGVLHVE